MDQKHSMANHLDNIRQEAKITIANFCEGICSERQYSRYLNGSQQIRQEKLNAFCDKIGFTPQSFYRTYYQSESRDYAQAVELFGLLYQKDLTKIKAKLDELDDYEFNYNFASKLYNFSIIKYQYLTKQVPLLFSLDQYSKLIDYPNVLEKEHVTFIDLVSMVEIARTAGLGKKDYTPLEYLYDFLVEDKYIYVSSDETHMMPSIYFTVAQFYGSLGDHNKCSMICDIGIAYHNKNNLSSNLSDLYYFKSLALYKLGNKDEAFRFARRCLYSQIAKGDIEEYRILSALLKKDYGIDPIEYMSIDESTKL